MLIAVDELRLHPVTIHKRYAAGELSTDDPDIEQMGPVEMDGQATVAGDGMRIRGRLKGTIRPFCARCLDPINTEVDADLDLLYQPASDLSSGQEVEIHEADTELAFFTGAGVEVEEVAREQMLLAVPMQPLCKESCRGLCPRCGKNLNQGACACPPRPIDDRWQGLQALKQKFERREG